MKDLAIDCLKMSEIGRYEGEGRKRATVRVVRLSPIISRPDFSPGSVEVEEYEA